MQQVYDFQEPETYALISCYIVGWSGQKQVRLYECRRCDLGAYHSRMSAGQLQWTSETTGPAGEEIVRRSSWKLSEVSTKDTLWLDYFESWDRVLAFLWQMRATQVEFL